MCVAPLSQNGCMQPFHILGVASTMYCDDAQSVENFQDGRLVWKKTKSKMAFLAIFHISCHISTENALNDLKSI